MYVRIWFTKYTHYLLSQTIPLSLLLPALQTSHANPTCTGPTSHVSLRSIIFNLKTLPLSTFIAIERSRAKGRNTFQSQLLQPLEIITISASKVQFPSQCLPIFSTLRHSNVSEANFSSPPWEKSVGMLPISVRPQDFIIPESGKLEVALTHSMELKGFGQSERGVGLLTLAWQNQSLILGPSFIITEKLELLLPWLKSVQEFCRPKPPQCIV